MKMLLMALPLAALPAAFSFVAASQAPASRPSTAIRYVSAQRIFAESADGKASVARMQTLQQQKAGELRTRQQTLETTRQQLAKAEGAERTQLQQQEQTQRVDFERATLQAQTDLQTLQRQVQTEVLGHVKTVLDDVTKGQRIDLVLNADQAVVWAAPGADLTDAVVAGMNARPAAAAPK